MAWPGYPVALYFDHFPYPSARKLPELMDAVHDFNTAVALVLVALTMSTALALGLRSACPALLGCGWWRGRSLAVEDLWTRR
jgi:hypothetical protein